MTREEEISLFIEMLKDSLEEIEEEYLTTAYQLKMFVQNEKLPYGFKIREDWVHKPGERIFAYELYSLLKGKIRCTQYSNKDFLNGIFLQAEVGKRQLFNILQELRFTRLSHNYIPDLILHQPAGDDNLCIIEIKASYDTDKNDIISDIDKIGEFMNRYRYQNGIFICLFNELEQLKGYISAEAEKYRRVFNAESAKKVEIICKNWFGEKYQSCILSEILYPNV